MSEPLKQRLLSAGVAGCSCQTKTPDLAFHLPMCRYRLYTEALHRIDDLEKALQFYAEAWSYAGEDGECGRVPNWLLVNDGGALALDALTCPALGYRGWACPSCGPIGPHEIDRRTNTHAVRYGGCGGSVESRA